MKEKLIKIQNAMVIHKKKIGIALASLLVLAVLSIGFHAIFEVEGVVTAKTNQSITVSNFFRTQTINLSGAPVDISLIQPGENVRISKNLKGEVLSIEAGRDHKGGNEAREHEKEIR